MRNGSIARQARRRAGIGLALVGAIGASGCSFHFGGSGSQGPEGPVGDAGATGARGATGPAGSTGSEVEWVDRTGAEVPVVAALGGADFLVLDSTTGFVWGANGDTGVLSPAAVALSGVWFVSSDCTGQSWLPTTLPPRYTFSVGSSPVYAVADDATAGTPGTFGSYVTTPGGLCVVAPAGTTSGACVSFGDAPSVTVPSSLFEPPLHPEYLP